MVLRSAGKGRVSRPSPPSSATARAQRRWRWGRTASSPKSTQEDSTFSADQLRTELAEAHEQLKIQDDPALREALSQDELRRDQQYSREVRDAERVADRADSLANVERRNRERALRRELDEQEHSDLLWFRRAQSEAQRLLSPAARTARLYRAYQHFQRSLIGVALIGLLWGADNVQSVVTQQFKLRRTDPGFWLAFGIEPLVTIPLIVLMRVEAVLANEGEEGHWRDQWPRRLTEVVLLGIAVAMNMLPHLGTGAAALLYALPPTMIAVAMILLTHITQKIGRLLSRLADQSGETDWSGPTEELTGRDTAGHSTVGPVSIPTQTSSATPEPTGGADRSTDSVSGPADRSAQSHQAPAHATVSHSSSQVSVRSAPGQHDTVHSGSSDALPPELATASGTFPTGQQPAEDQSSPETAPVGSPPTGQRSVPTSADRRTTTVSIPEAPAEQTVDFSDESLIDQILEPMALKLAQSSDWLSRQDVMTHVGCGAGKASRLLTSLNARFEYTPAPQPRRRPERDLEKDEALKATAPALTP